MTTIKKSDALEATVAQMAKQFGVGSVMRLGSRSISPVSEGVIPTGSLALDAALGVGGIPRGRVIEIFGPESCLDADTFIQYEVHCPEDGHRANHKGGSIERLWERFHGEPASGDGRGKYLRPVTKDAEFYAPSINEENRIFQNKIADVVKVGEKECFEITTRCGEVIVATAEHKFFTGNNYVPLTELKCGQLIFIHNNTPFEIDEPDREGQRAFFYVKSHPAARTKIVRDKIRGYVNEYKCLARSRAVVEAGMNSLPLETYIERLNSGDLEGLKFLRREDHVHHWDEVITNDTPDNLVVMTAREHGQLHSIERHNNLRFTAVPAVIYSITPVGMRQTYDIRMTSPFNNFVAGGFVVHNSGKTTLALHIIAGAQRAGGTAAFIDAEHALDAIYAKKLGVNVDDLLVSQPDNGEQALDIADALIKSGTLAICVVDSVAALVPKAELEGDMGEAHMGLQARLMSQALRKITGAVAKTKTCMIFINQIRDKIGVMFGSPETTTGGRALKFYASVRLDVRRVATIKNGDEVKGVRTKVKVTKNKVAPPFREAQFDIIYGVGISQEGDLLDVGVEHGVVEQKGAWFSYKGGRLGQGRDAAIQFLATNQETRAEIDAVVRKLLIGDK